MGQVMLSVNGQTYALACRDGDEENIATLAALVDERARDLASRLGQVGEARLLLMVALLLADEARAPDAAGPPSDSAAIAALDAASERVADLLGQFGAA